MSTRTTHERWIRVAGWFLAVSYGLAAPMTAYVEFDSHALSERFGYPPAFIYAVCAMQFVCALVVLQRRFGLVSCAALSVITLGAMVSHLRIASPMTAVPAVLYTVDQVWYGLKRGR